MCEGGRENKRKGGIVRLKERGREKEKEREERESRFGVNKCQKIQHGVASVSRIDKIIGFFCKRAL